MRIVVEVHNLEEAEKEITQKFLNLSGPAITAGVQRATMLITRDAKKFAPVDTGRLRASITPSVASDVASRGAVVLGIVGSNVEYAPYQELGTERMKGKFFLFRAFQKNRQKFERIIRAIVKGIVES